MTKFIKSINNRKMVLEMSRKLKEYDDCPFCGHNDAIVENQNRTPDNPDAPKWGCIVCGAEFDYECNMVRRGMESFDKTKQKR